MAMSAASPSVTGILTPDSLPPSTLADRLDGVTAPGPSDTARQPISSPTAMRGKMAAFWAVVPYAITASANT